MRVSITLLFLVLSTGSFCQQTYRVANTLWQYTKPAGYKTRADNFYSTIQAGDSVIRKNNIIRDEAAGEVLLFALAKTDSAQLNVVTGSYQDNANIVRYTLRSYVAKVAEFLKYNYAQLKSEAEVTTRETIIDGVPFYVIESRIHHREHAFTYWSALYITDLDGKELNITATYDNEADQKAIESSIRNSRFVFR